ncbi:hypothetical protein CH286_16345 [Rhodococcus sp. WWJCD1]|nr:hypothetical protein CH286_16345 [Rhodococcus sp. WWJCD1]
MAKQVFPKLLEMFPTPDRIGIVRLRREHQLSGFHSEFMPANGYYAIRWLVPKWPGTDSL